MSKPKYFLYARRSTEDDDKQVMSIEAQLFELREFARKENLEILAEFQESKSAKTPGRTVFGAMMTQIESGEASGILAWHPDRLARNSIDGGRVIYVVDQEKLVSLRFPTFWFEPTPQGLFMLQVAFGQSKYYSDNLTQNVKRGSHDFPFRNLFQCGECGGMFTAQFAKGNGGTYRYYRCTKKKGLCSQSYVQEAALAGQLKQQLQSMSLCEQVHRPHAQTN